MNLVERVVSQLKERRNRVLNGEVNCIPSAFPRFRNDFVGIEQGRYYLISAHQKCGKTNFMSYTFIYQPLLYAFNNPDKIQLKIFYYPLEETKEEIILRFMSFLLHYLSRGKIRIAPIDLKSTNEGKVLSEEILNLLESDQYQQLLNYFQDHIVFCESTNPTGMWKDMTKYAEANGTIHYEDVEVEDKLTGEKSIRKVFNYYTPKDPKEYVLIVWDHAGLTTLERGMDLRQTINKLSEYYVILRNKYNYSPVLVYQQSTETQSLDAYKSNKIRPTVAGLSDSKYPARDCSIMLGLSNPYAFELPEYLGYDITKFRDNIRFLEVVVNRFGVSNGILPLYFDGAVSSFNELPSSSDKNALAQIYGYMERVRRDTSILFLYSSSSKMKKKVNNFLYKWFNKTIFARLKK